LQIPLAFKGASTDGKQTEAPGTGGTIIGVRHFEQPRQGAEIPCLDRHPDRHGRAVGSVELLDPILLGPGEGAIGGAEPASGDGCSLKGLVGPVCVKKGRRAVREGIALPQRVGEIHAQRDLDALDRGQEQEAELLVEQVEVDGAAELGTWPELLAADGTRSIIRIEDDLLERLPIGGETRP
jgi:hypothetical protein